MGKILLRCDETRRFLTGLRFIDAPSPQESDSNAPVFRQVRLWFNEYFEGNNPDAAAIPLKPEGSLFQQEVWDILKTIPCGKTTTYGAIAKELERKTGRRASAQAAGGAIGRNPIAILIPCHRVIGTDGSLTGYVAGLERKRFLLDWERAVFSQKMPCKSQNLR